MNKVVSIKKRCLPDLMPSQAGKFHHIFNLCQEIFEKWGYLPLILSVYKHDVGLNKNVTYATESDLARGDVYEETFRESLRREIMSVIETHFRETPLPIRFWYGGPVVSNTPVRAGKRKYGGEEAHEMGIECVGTSSLVAEAEVISVALEILKTLSIRDFRLTLGDQRFLQGLSELNVKGARRKVSILRGDEDILTQAKGFGSHQICERALEDLMAVGQLLKEFGYKEPVQYDLNPFLAPSEYGASMFKIESRVAEPRGSASGLQVQSIISGGRRKTEAAGDIVGFSFDMAVLLEAVNRVGTPIPSPKIDFLLVNRKQSCKGTFEIMRVLREHGYSVVLDHSDFNREELLEYAHKSGMLNLMIVGDEDVAMNEVRLIDVTDKIGTKISISEIFDKKSGLNKLLRYHKRLELGQ